MHPSLSSRALARVLTTGLVVGTVLGGTLAAPATAAPAQDAQIVSGEVFMTNGVVEFGSRANGSFGSDIDAPAGYHPRTNGGNAILGFRSDRDKDGWGVGTDDGDFFTPGSPYEGWAVQVGTNPAVSNDDGGGGVVGSWTSANTLTGKVTATWQSSVPVDGIDVTQVVTIPDGAQYLDVDVTLTNGTGATIDDVFYLRGVDADNCVTRVGSNVCDNTGDGVANSGPNYKTRNTIVQQGATGDPSSIVSATQADGSYIDLRTTGAHTAASVGGGSCVGSPRLAFSGPPCGSGPWTKGSTNFADHNMYVFVRTPRIEAGASTTFQVRYVLSKAAADDLAPVAPVPPAPVPPTTTPQPPKPAAPAEPTKGAVSLGGNKLTVDGAKVGATCRTSNGPLRSCAVSMTAKVDGKVVKLGHKTRSFAGDKQRADVAVELNHRGRQLLNRLGGVEVKVTASVRAEGTTSAGTATRKVLMLPEQVRLHNVYFGAGSSRLDKQDRAYLAWVARNLDHAKSVHVVGHTDGQGSVAYNKALGKARAQAVRAAVAKGNGVRVDVVTRGDRRPVATNKNAKGRQDNRRATVVVKY